MSRALFRKPEFRLLLGYPSLVLLRPGRPPASASIAVPDPCAALAGLAAEVAAASGRLTAVLPEAEVWRGLLELPHGSPLARLRLARRAAAGALAAAPGAVAVALGPRDAGGHTPVAAVRHDVLAEARGFLARAGLHPAVITGDGDFPGFAAPPRLWSRVWRTLPAVPLPTVPLPAWPLPAPTRRAAALGGAAALALAVALALTLRPGAGPEPQPPAAVAVAPAEAVTTATPTAVAALRPMARPKDFAPPVAAAAAPTVRTAPPVPARSPDASAAPVVTMATRNVAFLPELPKPKGLPALRLAELTTARVRLADILPDAPFRRPDLPARAAPAAPAPTAATPVPAAVPAPETVAAPPLEIVTAPMRRPAAAPKPGPDPAAAAEPARSPVAVAMAALEPVAVAAREPEPGGRPLPRPGRRSEIAVLVASLAPDPAPAAIAAAPEPRFVAPPARPQRAAPAPAEPAVKRVASLQPAKAQPAPTRPAAQAQAVRVQPPPAKPAAQRQTVRVQPVPAPPAAQRQVIHLQPAPAKAAVPQAVRVQPAAKPAAQRKAVREPARAQAPAAKPAKERRNAARPARSNIVLVGIFGSDGERHALLQLSNGSVKKVRAGDRVQGVQVAAVGADSVRLHGTGRDAVLRMPE